MEFVIELITEDIIGLSVQLFFIITIFFMIKDDQKPPLATSIPTGIALIFFGAGGSIVAPLVAGLSVLAGTMWLFLGYQRYKKNTK